VVSTPELWTDFYRPFRLGRDLDRFGAAARFCVSRSATLPLSIHLESSRYPHDLPTPEDMRTLFSAADRFESLTLRSENTQWNGLVCEMIQQSRMPRLKTLTVATDGISHLDLSSDHFPALESIRCQRYATVTAESTVWRNVKNASFHDTSNAAVLHRLESCRNLRILSLENVDFCVDIQPGEPITLPLEELNIIYSDAEDQNHIGDGLMNHLVCPHLTKIVIETPGNHYHSPPLSSSFSRSLAEFLQCSKPPLRSLHVPNHGFTEHELRELCLELPILKDLVFGSDRNTTVPPYAFAPPQQ
jgi:hypothetical protein